MVSFVILLVARTARITWRTDRQTDRMKSTKVQTLGRNIGTFGLETPICMHYVLGIYRTSFQHNLHCFIDACVHVVNNYIPINRPVDREIFVCFLFRVLNFRAFNFRHRWKRRKLNARNARNLHVPFGRAKYSRVKCSPPARVVKFF